jgi:hypothetical protein
MCFTISRVDARKCGLSRVQLGKRMCLMARAKSQKFAIVLNQDRAIRPLNSLMEIAQVAKPADGL